MAKLAIILFSGSSDKLQAASILTSGGAATDTKVRVFATFWGLMALTKKGISPRVSADFKEFQDETFKIMNEKKVPSWIDLMKQAKSTGDVKFYACSMTYDLFGLKKDDLLDIVDDVVGVGTFLDDARDADITLFI
ncbi:MAG: DsrE/DsrF/DrsH-like family protein [Candidatus Bathyarchaeia archaeon]